MMRTREAATAIGRQLPVQARGADVEFTSVFTDSRAIEPQGLFVALRGDRFDGHAFVATALSAGAAAAMVDDQSDLTQWPDAPLLIVSDTKLGLGAMASAWRARFDLPVIGVVGSNGKTTTKDMTAAMLRAEYGAQDVLATAGNLNNDIGVPLTLLKLRDHHRAAVIEIGMNRPGETATLAAMAQPTIALITNAQREHQEFMNSVTEVAAEHAALLAALPGDGVAVLNADDAFIDFWQRVVADREVLRFGLDESAEVSATYTLAAAGTELTIRLPAGQTHAHLAIPGVHSVRNALGAAAAASAAGVRLPALGAGIGAFAPAKGRLEVKRAAAGGVLIDDTYNANPDSVRAAIDVLAGGLEASAGATTLVLGDMGEVGAQGEAFHREVGEYARERGISALHVLGDAAQASATAFGAGAVAHKQLETLIAAVRARATTGATVLVKGSRFMRMERVVSALLEPGN